MSRARLLHAIAIAAWSTDDTAAALERCAEAARLLPAEPPSALRARVLALLARVNFELSRDDEAARRAAEALALTRELDLVDVAADVATSLARLDERAGKPELAAAALRESIAQARSAGATAAELRGLFNLGGLHFDQGQLDAAFDAYHRGWDLSVAIGQPWAPYAFQSRTMAGVVAYIRGDWDLAGSILDVGGDAPPALIEASITAARLDLAAGRGDLDALAHLAGLREWCIRDGWIAITCGAPAIELLAQSGDLPAAISMHDDVVDAVTAQWQEPMFEARIRLSAVLLGVLGAAAVRAGAADRAAYADRGIALATITLDPGRLARPRGRRRGPESQAWLARLRAECARLRWICGVEPPELAELLDLWRAAVDAFERFGHRYETARSRGRLAAVLRAGGDAAAARTEVDAARAEAESLRAGPLLAELRTLAGPGSSSHHPPSSRRDEPLTARENEVLALVAAGRSNSQIAGQLFISPKTVSVHVSNILAKFGASGRTEAVAIARRHGLLTDEVARDANT